MIAACNSANFFSFASLPPDYVSPPGVSSAHRQEKHYCDWQDIRVRNWCADIKNHVAASPIPNYLPSGSLAMSQLRARPSVSRRVPHDVAVYGMRAVVFSGAGILLGRNDYQLRGHDRMRINDIPGVAAVSGFHKAFDQHENTALDGLCHCIVPGAGAARLCLLARPRFLGKSAKT